MADKKTRCPLGWTRLSHRGMEYDYMPKCIGSECALWRVMSATDDEVGECGIANALGVAGRGRQCSI